MTILYFYQYFGTPKGGWSTRVYEFTRRWVEKGHKVIVVTALYDKSDITANGLFSKHKIDNIDIITINVKISNKQRFFYRLYTFIVYAIMSCYFALSLKYDIVIASSGPISIGLPGLIAKYVRKKTLVFEVRDLWPEGAIQLGYIKSDVLKKIFYWFEKRCYLASTLIVALSEGMAASIRSRFDLSNVIVIPNASDNIFFSSSDFSIEIPFWAKGKNIFLYTGSLGVMDDCSQLVFLAQELQLRGATDPILIVFGDGKEKQDLESLKTSLKLNNIFFMGLLPKIEIAAWYKFATASFLVFKNVEVLNTCSPNKIFDSFAAGVPVIQTTQGWIKELFYQEKCGITVLPNNATEMADAVQLLAYNTEVRNDLAKNAKRVALEYFDRDVLSEKMLNALKVIVKDG